MNVLVVGSGGREHALVWALSRCASVSQLHAAPGNPGIAEIAACHPVAEDDADGLLDLSRALDIDLVVVGPEVPLVAGVADALRHGGISVFGPGAAAARIEGSKSFAKDVMDAAGVPTARRLTEPVAPCVVKVDGLAAGKGVVVCRTDEELATGLEALRALGGKLAVGGELIVEELLEGPEVSVFALSDGVSVIPLAAAQDSKRAYDGDLGPNTGGMGSYSPVPGIGPTELRELVAATVTPVVDELARRGTPFVGVLFAGLMLTSEGPRVLEYNCRFGDPETQSVLPLVDGDLAVALAAAAAGDLTGVELGQLPGGAVTVVVTGENYPEAPLQGAPIDGLAEASETGALVFHAGTALRDGRLVANGGRLLGITGTGESLAAARATAYRAVGLVELADSRVRTDIGAEAAAAQSALPPT
jgi:phosphoribosylamine---glycine ligase